MSRIHEALKKAEQDRAASQGGSIPAPPSFVPAAEPAITAMEESPVAVAAGSPAAAVPFPSAIPSFASPFSLDALLARCPKKANPSLRQTWRKFW